jgi:FMN-dependent dehydrogenase
MEDEPVNIREFEEIAKRVLPKMLFDYYNGGAEDEHTLRENMEAFKRILYYLFFLQLIQVTHMFHCPILNQNAIYIPVQHETFPRFDSP